MSRSIKRATKAALKAVATPHSSITFNKAFGQHILVDQNILRNIMARSAVRSTDIVLEIGPGTGNLTALLLEAAKKVTAIELDKRMVGELKKRFGGNTKLDLIEGDFMKTTLPFFDLCVANIPYQISSPLVFKLLAHRPIFRCAVLMFQREFALRLVAQPGTSDYSRLSVTVQLLSRCQMLFKVSKSCFKPPPKVESAIVRIEPIYPPPRINYSEWDGLLRTCFNRKNKTLSSLFRKKKLLKLLETNYLAYCRLAEAKAVIEQEEKESPEGPDIFSIMVDEADKEEEKQDAKQEESDDDGLEEYNSDQDEQVAVETKLRGKKGEQELRRKYLEGQDFKEKVQGVLEKEGFAKQRPGKMSCDDFLRLLSAFNKEGIHFK